MREMLKKSILAGLGTAVVTKSTVQQIMDMLVEQGKLTTEEAERYTHEIIEAGENEWHELKDCMNQTGRKFLSQINVADKQDLEDLKEQFKNLEQRIEYLEERMKKSTPAPESSDQ
jgi:polyhydroxyalkanoate synthesis regulator phasin